MLNGTRRFVVFVLCSLACAVPALGAANGGVADDRNLFFNSSLFALCGSRDAGKRETCTAYLGGFAEGYIWNSQNRCYAPTPDKFREEYLAALRRDRALIGDPSGAILFALMDRLTTDKCEGIRRNAK